MKKSLVFFLLVLCVLSLAMPSFAILKSAWLPDVGMSTSTISADMSELNGALSNFAASHPNAAVDSFQIVAHSVSGSYDIFIMYRED